MNIGIPGNWVPVFINKTNMEIKKSFKKYLYLERFEKFEQNAYEKNLEQIRINKELMRWNTVCIISSIITLILSVIALFS